MNIAHTIPVAFSGWWIVMPVMMLLCMGGMMLMMRGMGSGSSRGRAWPWERFMKGEGPVETLDRRFAEGEISIDEYRARRQALVNGSTDPDGAHEDERLTAAPRGGGRES
jgi:uncharacterized membrane protein